MKRRRVNEKLILKLSEVERDLLQGIGEPEEGGFVPSPFQLEALEHLFREEDVIVVAPTGSGKTWIALKAIERYLEEGKDTWYTTPLKALSNQKYDQLCEIFGPENVGLLTGERRENPSAPVIVATTEVLRNLLYRGERIPQFVVLDEAHYLGDEERGTAWEEVIILSSPDTQLLLLSATISNVEELASWMGSLRGKRPKVVRTEGRPVPLRYALLGPEGRLLPLEEKFLSYARFSARKGPQEVLQLLGEKGLLPAIWFLPTRRQCDQFAKSFSRIPYPGAEKRLEIFKNLAGEDPYLWNHPLLEALIKSGVASHHAGHLTGWKVIVEKMLSLGVLRGVFATTTLAAGLDVPARTVVLGSFSRGNGELSALEFHQMTGRAGRRGKDKVGFVVLVSRNRRDLRKGLEFTNKDPEPLRSSFRFHYYQILNLLDRFELEEVREFVKKSFLLYQIRSGKKKRKVTSLLLKHLDRRIGLLKELGYLDEDLNLTEEGKWCLLLRHESSLIISEIIRRNLWNGLGPSSFAGWIGSLASEKAPQKLVTEVNLRALRKLILEIEALERKWGIASLELREFYKPQAEGSEGERRAAAIRAWAEGMPWPDLVRKAHIEEGDLQRLILQTSELLREIGDLPLEVSALAQKARELILRPPVFPTDLH
jgi:superfamily II RNA helicase